MTNWHVGQQDEVFMTSGGALSSTSIAQARCPAVCAQSRQGGPSHTNRAWALGDARHKSSERSSRERYSDHGTCTPRRQLEGDRVGTRAPAGSGW